MTTGKIGPEVEERVVIPCVFFFFYSDWPLPETATHHQDTGELVSLWCVEGLKIQKEV